MCTEVYIGDTEINSVGELKAAIGAENVIFDPTLAECDIGDSHCLCCVNVRESAERAGYVCKRNSICTGFDLFKNGDA